MATILSLHRSITDMPEDEAVALVREIRRSRAIVKKVTKTKAGNSGTKRAPAKPKDPFSNLSEADKLALIAALTGGDDAQ